MYFFHYSTVFIVLTFSTGNSGCLKHTNYIAERGNKTDMIAKVFYTSPGARSSVLPAGDTRFTSFKKNGF